MRTESPNVQVRLSTTRITDLLSVALVVAGVVIGLQPITALRSLAGQSVRADALASSIGYLLLGSQLAIVGVAFYAYSLWKKRSVDEFEELDSTLDRIEAITRGQKGTTSKKTAPTIQLPSPMKTKPLSKFSGLHLLALLEGFGLVVLLGWLVAEFKSNAYMQQWVGANMTWGTYILNDYFLILALGVLTGITISKLTSLRKAFRTRSHGIFDEKS